MAAHRLPDMPRAAGAGSSINYEGGVLDNPARVAIHATHRLGALAARDGAGARRQLFVLRRRRASRSQRPRAWRRCWPRSGLQLLIGVSMVLKGPSRLWLATAHTAGAAPLLLAGDPGAAGAP